MAARGAQKNTRPPAEVPVDTGKHMRACKRCKLLKTLEQVCVCVCAALPRELCQWERDACHTAPACGWRLQPGVRDTACGRLAGGH